MSRASRLLAVAALSGCMVGDPGEPGSDDQTDPSHPEFEDESEVEFLPEAPYDDTSDVLFAMSSVGSTMRVCGATALNQRTGPGTSYSILRSMPEDSRVTVVEISNNWVHADWNGNKGWSNSRYLCATTTPPPVTSDSESVNAPNNGRLENSVQIGPHPRYVVAVTGRDAEFATVETLLWLDMAFDALHTSQPTAATPQIRDMSILAGGRRAGEWPHASHQSGRDVDITYPQHTCSSITGCPLEDVSASTLDVAATWTLLDTWLSAGVARRIFIDASLHPLLRAEAQRRGRSKAELDKWFGPVIQHVTNHLNHLHVRFRCPDDDRRCTG